MLDRRDFVGEQVGEELGVGGLVALGLFERGRELLGDRREPEVVDVGAQLLVDGFGHQHASVSKAA